MTKEWSMTKAENIAKAMGMSNGRGGQSLASIDFMHRLHLSVG